MRPDRGGPQQLIQALGELLGAVGGAPAALGAREPAGPREPLESTTSDFHDTGTWRLSAFLAR
jgi:hypothetical protein